MNISEIKTVEHDVIVLGAGGAGLRAAIECSMEGLSTGLVCKSLLGKAHTVMAEGGVAASLANVDNRDHWKVHFRDTMRGGKFLNNWRMAELHAREAPARVRELEEWGAVFDRTKSGLINQRNFGGHRYPRLAHVGDRTGLEIIRTLQDHGIHQGIDIYMECTGLDFIKDGDRISGMVGMWRDNGEFIIFICRAIILATGGGTPCFNDNMDLIKKNGISIFIDSKKEILVERINKNKNRPLFKGVISTDKKVSELYKERFKYYNRSDFSVNNTEEILSIINSYS